MILEMKNRPTWGEPRREIRLGLSSLNRGTATNAGARCSCSISARDTLIPSVGSVLRSHPVWGFSVSRWYITVFDRYGTALSVLI